MIPSVHTWCRTRKGLPDAIPCSKNTLDRCLLLPGAPKPDKRRGWHLETIRSFIQTNTTKGAPAANLQAARAEHEIVKIEERRERVAILKGEHFPRSVGIEASIRMGAAVNSALAAAEASLPSRLLGLDETAMQRVIRAEHDLIRAELAASTNALYGKRHRPVV